MVVGAGFEIIGNNTLLSVDGVGRFGVVEELFLVMGLVLGPRFLKFTIGTYGKVLDIFGVSCMPPWVFFQR